MCIVSQVFDHYSKRPDDWWKGAPTTPPRPVAPPFIPDPDVARQRIDEFFEAVEAAQKVDELTEQPDCVDPEKLSLLERIERIERELGLT